MPQSRKPDRITLSARSQSCNRHYRFRGNDGGGPAGSADADVQQLNQAGAGGRDREKQRLERDGESLAHGTILLIDQRNTPRTDQAFAIQRVVKFMQTRRKTDRIGIYTFMNNDSLQAAQEFTDNAELLSGAAKSLKARDPSRQSLDTKGMTAHAADDHMPVEVMTRTWRSTQWTRAD